jgi:hypothetical protein
VIAKLEKITNISTKKISYYSIKFNNQEYTEYQRFVQKDFPNHVIESQILRKILTQMGLSGAKPWYFKFENGASALPVVSPKIKKANQKDFGLRLYAIHLSESIVILLNGDIKSVSTSAQHCPKVSKFFNNAIALYKKIGKAQDDDMLRLEGLNIEFDENFIIDL